MSTKRDIAALYDALAEHTFEMSDEEILEECREEGQSLKEMSDSLRSRLSRTLKEHQQEALNVARAVRAQEIEQMERLSHSLPTDPGLLRALFDSVVRRPGVSEMLTVQARELKSMTDDDIKAVLMDLAHLGVDIPDRNREQ